jgi:hypothetical protein
MIDPLYEKIQEYASLEAGYDACNALGRGHAFVVRACGDKFGLLASIRSQIRLEKSVYGTNYGTTVTKFTSGKECLCAWDDNTLAFNVIDSVSTRGHSLLMPAYLAEIGRESGVSESMWLAYVVSAASSQCGELHVDPPFGSGWQYLAQGIKQWFIIDEQDPSFSLKSYNATSAAASGPDMSTIAASMGSGRIYSAVISTGDFLSCPLDWPHAVFTREKSIGLSGYTATPELRQAVMAEAALLVNQIEQIEALVV